MYACMTPVGFDTSDKFENHCSNKIKVLFSNVRRLVSAKRTTCSILQLQYVRQRSIKVGY